jgi:hypothetical protein
MRSLPGPSLPLRFLNTLHIDIALRREGHSFLAKFLHL